MLDQPIPLSSPDIGEDEEIAVLEVLRSGRLSLGPALPLFEDELARALGSAYAVAVNSGTSALHLAVKAAGIGPGDEVITTPFSFVASANCILYEGAIPRFVDIDSVTLNMDVNRIEGAITEKTKAILPVHVFGRPCQMAEILDIAQRHHLTVIEDACEAIGAVVDGKNVGTFGRSGVFAFYPNKQLTTGEGGAIVTDDPDAAKLFRSWRNQGRGDTGAWLQHERLGYNYRLSDINCAIGAVQVRRLPEILAKRARVAETYSRILSDIVPEVICPAPAAPGSSVSWFVYVVQLPDRFSQEDRDSILRHLKAVGIGCNDYFSPIHLQEFYRQKFGYTHGSFPVTEKIAQRTIALPFFNNLTENQIELVGQVLAGVISKLRTTDLVAVA
jgi:perosamine synthetase